MATVPVMVMKKAVVSALVTINGDPTLLMQRSVPTKQMFLLSMIILHLITAITVLRCMIQLLVVVVLQIEFPIPAVLGSAILRLTAPVMRTLSKAMLESVVLVTAMRCGEVISVICVLLGSIRPHVAHATILLLISRFLGVMLSAIHLLFSARCCPTG